MAAEYNGPLRRADDLEIHSVEDGLVVYDPKSDRVHYLNHTAGLVLELCDGKVSSQQIAEMIGAAYELDQPPQREVDDCVDQLIQEGLIDGG